MNSFFSLVNLVTIFCRFRFVHSRQLSRRIVRTQAEHLKIVLRTHKKTTEKENNKKSEMTESSHGSFDYFHHLFSRLFLF